MSSVSPPKPWERAGANGTLSTTSAMTANNNSTNAISDPSSATMASSLDPSAPSLPDRPSALNSVVNQTASNYSAYGQNRFSSPYSSYSSPYSSYGSGYGMGGYGMGGGYGGYGMGGMGGMGGMYNRPYGSFGQPGMPNDPNNPNSLTQTWNQSTAATFQIMESIVGAFGGFAQMLESAYMTTHSSFFAMVSMAEQLGNLRTTLGQVLGIYTLIRWIRTLMAKITGRPLPADATSLTPANFSSFLSGGSAAADALPNGAPAPPRASKKPFIMFTLAVFGLPYLMSKLIRSMARAQEAEEQRRLAEQGIIVRADGSQQIDPSKLDFCRVLYDYKPGPQSVGMDLEVTKGDLVAVLSKTDPMGNASEWWRCRARDGKMGYVPGVYLQKIERKLPQIAATAHDNGTISLPGSRTQTLKGSDVDGSRTKSLTEVSNAVRPEVKGGPGDISADSFQRSAFYN